MILSILIPTVPERKNLLNELIKEINFQINSEGLNKEIEICINDIPKGQITTGEKRNILLSWAVGEYVWFIDDDDWIYPGAIKIIYEALKNKPDCLAINGIISFDGNNSKKWYIAINNPYCADWSTGTEIYLRYPNHITPMKREYAVIVGFPSQSNFEDKAFADRLKELNLLKTEIKIDQPIYHYRYSSQNKLY